MHCTNVGTLGGGGNWTDSCGGGQIPVVEAIVPATGILILASRRDTKPRKRSPTLQQTDSEARNGIIVLMFKINML